MSSPTRPITALISALGGEGGGVLTNWIIAAAARQGFPAQSTSIPGVAQRTGSTTYYIEIVPTPARELPRKPVLALVPGIGDIDLMIASELLEASRAVANGFVTRDRTLVITSTSRMYTMPEKMAMGDGRLDSGKMLKAIEKNAKERVAFDMDALARDNGAMINSVMLGAIAGSGVLPIPLEAFEAAIRDEGKAADANARGFRAGLEAVRRRQSAAVVPDRKRPGRRVDTAESLEAEVAAWPAAARDVAIEGVRRLAAYQDVAYARLYLDRLQPFRAGDARLLTEVARHLAVRMSYEDVIRVAQAKADPARFARIVEEKKIGPDEPFMVIDFLKPGFDEICQVLPPSLATRVLGYAERRGWRGRAYFGMHVKSTSVLGYLRFWMLAKLRRVRRSTYRYLEEQMSIEGWLGSIAHASKRSSELALEIAECARLIKGYGDTHTRGSANFAIIETRLIRPALAGTIPVARAVDAIASARTAALLDPDGESLARSLAEFERQAPLAVAAE